MNELKSELKRPMDRTMMGDDVAQLNGLLNLLNNPAITGAEVPPDAEVKAPAPVIPAAAATPPPVSRLKFDPSKLAFTGRLGVGKDYVATALGATIFGFADPMYAIASYFFGVEVTATQNKDLPGMREFLQTIGQWGWGANDEKYPLTPARAVFSHLVRQLGAEGKFGPTWGVEWERFGLTKDLWAAACLRRVRAFQLSEGAGRRVAITNCRFEHEFAPLRDDGWAHVHVMCSPTTWAARLAKKKLTPESPAVKNPSEQLAAAMDADVMRKITGAGRTGGKLRVIWNDEAVPPPSPRLYSLAEFKALVETPVESASEAPSMALE